MRVLQAPSLAAAHTAVIRHIVKNAYLDAHGRIEEFPGENHQTTIECKELALFVKTPLLGDMFIPPPMLPFSQAFMDQYAHDLIYGSPADHVYSYHERLQKWCACQQGESYNQINYILQKLVANPNSRRAIATTWYVNKDQTREDVPCLQVIHCDTREGKLNMKVVFRSEDMLYGLGPNMYGLVRLQEVIADTLDMKVGSYTHVTFCPHIYHRRDANHLQNFVPLWW